MAEQTPDSIITTQRNGQTTICVCRCRNTTSTRQSLWIVAGIITWRDVMAKLTKYEKETIILFNEGEGHSQYLHLQCQPAKATGIVQ